MRYLLQVQGDQTDLKVFERFQQQLIVKTFDDFIITLYGALQFNANNCRTSNSRVEECEVSWMFSGFVGFLGDHMVCRFPEWLHGL